jgi:hypothetical protein
MNMEHAERQRWVEQVAQINTRLNEGSGAGPSFAERHEAEPQERGSDQEAQNE